MTKAKKVSKRRRGQSGSKAMLGLKVFFEVVAGPEGHCLCICGENTGFRLAGPKPWGGGTVVHKFEVDCYELMEQMKLHAEA